MQKTIGIPRALLYYKYYPLWKAFFESLGYELIISGKTTTRTIERGSLYLVDEACLSMKIFMGHVEELLEKCDFLFVPRIISLKKKEKLCTNFSALYDIVKTAFPKETILNYNIDMDHGKSEEKAFLSLAKQLHIPIPEIKKAYKNAKVRQKEYRIEKYKQQKKALESTNLKILLAGHPYNLYDEQIGIPIATYLKQLGVTILWSDIYDQSTMARECSKISSSVYWTYSKELLGAISHYKKKVDGILVLSTFPCGTDSLTNEMCVRKIKDTPLAVILIDEQNSGTGLYTRLESFVDILERRAHYAKTNH